MNSTLFTRLIFLICCCFTVCVSSKIASGQTKLATYPTVTGYVGILHPIVTSGDEGSHFNFDKAYVVGMPTGINIWKSSAFGFSMEIVPFIRFADGNSKMNNLLFHPGVLITLVNGFTLAGRVAFETSGRYGITPVLSKVVARRKDHSYFIALPVPARFGNDTPGTLGIGFQFGIAF